ncbi:MAG: ribonuclease J [Candidatus Paceibacterota bacterium]|jgi:ribonuclease J
MENQKPIRPNNWRPASQQINRNQNFNKSKPAFQTRVLHSPLPNQMAVNNKTAQPSVNSSVPLSPKPFVPNNLNGQLPSSNGHRIVLGKGAKKHPEMVRHIAGARMNVIRKESRGSPKGRGRPARSLVNPNGNGSDIIPTLAPDSIRIIPLGGVEEIGRNMTAIEFGEDIIVIDIGFQFRDENTPGIDYILPNTKYLEERQGKIRAVLITHGHLDHIGGIPYIMPRIGNPVIYTRLLTSVLITKRQEEFPHVPKLDIKVVEKNETITIGKLRVKFFAVTHTIPDAMGVIIETPYGSIVHTGDLKLDHLDGIPTAEEVAEYDRAFKKENVLMLMADSTNVENPGFSMPEKVVHKNIEEVIKNVKGRLIIATFSSLLERLIKIIDFAEIYGKKVVVEGRSMKSNLEICKHLGLLKAKESTMISTDDMENYPPDRIIILATGAQGDEFAAMMRMSNKTHAKIRITPRDTVMLSSSIIPGNERAVQKLKDNLSRQGARIIHYKIADVHSSGHANRDETAWIHRAIHPKFFMPVHGYHYLLRAHADIAKEANGLKEEDVVIPDNSSIIEIQNGGTKIVKLKEKAASGLVLVDGFSVGDVQDVVIRDRQMLAQDGIFIIFGIINASNGKLKKSPDIISRGFVYLRESQELLHEVRLIIKDTVEKSTRGQNPINVDFVKDNITDAVSKFLVTKTAKRPMVIPVILTI